MCPENVEAVFQAKDLMQPSGRGWLESGSKAQREVKQQMPAGCQWEKGPLFPVLLSSSGPGVYMLFVLFRLAFGNNRIT